MARVCIFGDSITWGAWDLEMGGWVARLRHEFDNNHFGTFEVYNGGISGDKVSDILNRFDIEAEARQPEVIVLAVGINDSRHEDYEGTDLNLFKQQFEKLVKKSLAVTGRVIIIGLTNVMTKDDDSFKDESIKQYDEIIESVAGENHLLFVEIFGLIEKKDLELDGLHPEAGGHKVIAEKVRDVLLTLKK